MKNLKFQKKPSDEVRKELIEYEPFLQDLLFARDIKSKKKADEFINPDWNRDIHDPFLMLNMKKIVLRLLKSIDNGEKIVIYSDYDADGIPGAVILHDFFKKIDYNNFTNYIPHRHKEGFGLNNNAIKSFFEDGAKLIITIDCGITDIKQVDFANKHKIDVIITDHHLPQDILPKAFAILDNKQEGDKYPDKNLCGASMVFKLVCALIAEGKKEKRKNFLEIEDNWHKVLLDMVGISTVADMVPLIGENRALAYFGLKVLRLSRRNGLRRLFDKSKISQKELNEDDIGFTIAPLINSASRMDHPLEAFKLLSTRSSLEAEKQINYLLDLNNKRKRLTTTLSRQSYIKIDKKDLEDLIVVGDRSWEPGVLGLIANKVMERYKRPTFVWGQGQESDHIKGSCRSDGSVSVVEVMQGVEEGYFLGFGGHKMSGGFSISSSKVALVEDKILEAFRSIEKFVMDDFIFVDAKFELKDFNNKTFESIKKLQPFGVSNPKPLFLFENLEIRKVSAFGKAKEHLSLMFDNNIRAIKFFAKDDIEKGFKEGDTVSILAYFEESVFNGRRERRLKIVDFV